MSKTAEKSRKTSGKGIDRGPMMSGSEILVACLEREGVDTIFALAGPLLHLFGRNFPEGALAMRILIIGQFCNVLVGPTGAVLNMTRYDRLMNKLAMISVVVNFVVSAWLAPSWGAAGAATGSSAGLVVLNGLAWYFIRRKLGFSTIRL